MKTEFGELYHCLTLQAGCWALMDLFSLSAEMMLDDDLDMHCPWLFFFLFFLVKKGRLTEFIVCNS